MHDMHDFNMQDTCDNKTIKQEIRPQKHNFHNSNI